MQKKNMNRLIAVIIALIMSMGLLNISVAEAENIESASETETGTENIGNVHILIENNIWDSADGAAWCGILLDTCIEICEDDDIISLVNRALETVGKTAASSEASSFTDICGVKAAAYSEDCGWKCIVNSSEYTGVLKECSVADGYIKDGTSITLQYQGTPFSDLKDEPEEENPPEDTDEEKTPENETDEDVLNDESDDDESEDLQDEELTIQENDKQNANNEPAVTKKSKPSAKTKPEKQKKAKTIKAGLTRTMTKKLSLTLGGDADETNDKISELINPSDTAKNLPTDFTKLTDEQLSAIIDAYKEYETLSADEKLRIKNKDKFEQLLEKVGKVMHRDDDTGIIVEGIEWRYKIEAKEKKVTDEREKLHETLNQDSDILSFYDIHLTDIVTSKEYQPDKAVTVKIPSNGIEKYESAIILHIGSNDDGVNNRYEYIKCKADGKYLVFKTQSFSPYGVIGMNGTWDSLLTEEKEEKNTMLWPCVGLAAVAALCIMFIASKKQRNDR